jgi:hypothetical protein
MNLQFNMAAERLQSAARGQEIIHTARFYRESAALRCSAC